MEFVSRCVSRVSGIEFWDPGYDLTLLYCHWTEVERGNFTLADSAVE